MLHCHQGLHLNRDKIFHHQARIVKIKNVCLLNRINKENVLQHKDKKLQVNHIIIIMILQSQVRVKQAAVQFNKNIFIYFK
jgi:hypothetical protein